MSSDSKNIDFEAKKQTLDDFQTVCESVGLFLTTEVPLVGLKKG